MRIAPRSEWGARPAESITYRDPASLRGVVVHWFGSPRGEKDHRDCPGQIRAVQRAHQMGEFNDIAYNHLVCPHGSLYEGRGFGVQTGANGFSQVNRDYAAIVAMIGSGDVPQQPVYTGLRDLILAWRGKGAGLTVRTHGSITGSECPGPDIRAWVNHSGWKGPVSPEDPPNFWTWLRWYEGRDEFRSYGKRNPAVRPGVVEKIPATWWLRRAAWLARNSLP